MRRAKGNLRWWVAIGALAFALLALFQLEPLLLAIRLGLSLRELAAGHTGPHAAVAEHPLDRTMEGEGVKAVLYYSAGASPKRAVILVPGISELGCYHPRLVALARILAARGFAVLTPDIPPLRDFAIAPETVDHISFWMREIAALPEGAGIRRVGIGGISFSGTLALMAAARPENRDAAAFVLSIGGYSDLVRCAQGWFAEASVKAGEGNYPTRYYARWVAMLGSLEILQDESERAFMRGVLTRLLRQQEVPELPVASGQSLSRWYRLALGPGHYSDPGLAEMIIRHLASETGPRLSPDAAAAEIRCPVFLAHGAYDDLIPPSESVDLRQKIRNAPAYLLISPFLTHTHPATTEIGTIEKISSGARILVLLFRLAVASRPAVLPGEASP